MKKDVVLDRNVSRVKNQSTNVSSSSVPLSSLILFRILSSFAVFSLRRCFRRHIDRRESLVRLNHGSFSLSVSLSFLSVNSDFVLRFMACRYRRRTHVSQLSCDSSLQETMRGSTSSKSHGIFIDRVIKAPFLMSLGSNSRCPLTFFSHVFLFVFNHNVFTCHSNNNHHRLR